MRKIVTTLSLAIFILLILIWPYIIFPSKNISIGELNLKLQLDGNGWLLTRSNARSGLPIDLYKLIKQIDIDQEFKKADIYLQANYNGFEIQIDAFADLGTVALFDLDRLSNKEQLGVLQSFAEQYPGQQLSLYQSATASYIVIEYTDKKLADSYTAISYMTIKNGKLISISLLCPDKQTNSLRAAKLKQIVDSIQYQL